MENPTQHTTPVYATQRKRGKMDTNASRPRKNVPTWASRATLLDGEQHLLVERPQPNVSLITLNRPECKNLMTHRTRAQLFNQLQINDQDPDVRVTIIQGAGGNFSAGNDFDTNRDEVLPFFEPDIDGQTSRHVLNGWFMMNDLAKPVIAMIEGEATGGGLELAAACDVCICAHDAMIGYSAVRGQGLADYQILPWLCGMRNAMELILTNKPMTGIEAVQRGFATEAVPAAELTERTMNFALRVAKIPADLLAFNKKSVHRAFEAQGMRTNLRNGVDLEALMFKAPGAKMLTARRGPQKGTPTAQRVPPPRPAAVMSTTPSVAVQAVSAKSNTAVSAKSNVAMPAVLAKSKDAAKGGVAAKPPQTPNKLAPSPGSMTAPKTVSAKPSTAPVNKVVNDSAAIKSPTVIATVATTKPATAKPATTAMGKPAPTASAKPAPSVNKQQQQLDKTSAQGKVVVAEEESVHVHLHEAVHIHIGGQGISASPSKL